MTALYIPSNWFWLVAGSPGFFSSQAGAFVQQLPTTASPPTPIASQQALWDVLQGAGVPLPAGATSAVAAPLAAQVATLNAKVGIAVSAQVLA